MVSEGKADGRDFLDLVEWMIMPDAAKHLTDRSGIVTNEARILQYAMNGQLKLSVNILYGTPAMRCLGNIAEVVEFIGKTHEPNGVWEILRVEDEVFHLKEGIYDLPMIGAEKNVVKSEWQKLSGVLIQERLCSIGTVLEGENGHLYIPLRLIIGSHNFDSEITPIDSANIPLDSVVIDSHYVQLNGLPDDSILVVRTSALRELEEMLAGKKKGIKSRENTEHNIRAGNTNSAKVFDSGHSWHSKTLALAISAWEELYADRKDSPAEFKPPGGHIAFIRDWLKKNAPSDVNLSATAIEHMAAIINPDKSKGPGKTKKLRFHPSK